MIVQRLLAARNCGQSQAALLASWVVIFVQFTLFLAIGTCLFVVYQEQGQAAPAVLDRLYPLYIWQSLPAGVAGLVMAAILAAAMSNLSAALNSLASTTVLDLWKPILGGFNKSGASASDATWLRPLALCHRCLGDRADGRGAARAAMGKCVAGGALDRFHRLRIAAGRFPAGFVHAAGGRNRRDVRDVGGISLLLSVRFATPIAFTWYVLIGASATFVTAVLVSLRIREAVHGA